MNANGQRVVERSGTDRLLALGGMVGPVLFVVVIIVAGVLYEGYSHVSQAISELGGEGAEYGLLQSINFIAIGVFTLGFAWALARDLGGSIVGPLLIAVFALSSSIANGLLPCDLGCEGQTTVGLLHNVTGITGFVAAIAGMLVLARRWRADPRWRSHVAFTRGAAFVALAGLIAFIGTKASDAEAIDGLVQRVFVTAILAWVFVTSVRLHRLASRREVAAEGVAER